MSEVKIYHEEKITVKRKEHPNNKKYPGRPSFEFGQSVNKFMAELRQEDKDDVARFILGELVFREDITADFFDSIQVGDVVGLGLYKGSDAYGINPKKAPCASKFEILKINKDEDTMIAKDVTYKVSGHIEEIELTFEQISCAFGLGFGEILERDGKPFGVSEEEEFNLKIFMPDDGQEEVKTETTEEANNEADA